MAYKVNAPENNRTTSASRTPPEHLPFSLGVRDIASGADIAKLLTAFAGVAESYKAAGQSTKLKVLLQRVDDVSEKG